MMMMMMMESHYNDEHDGTVRSVKSTHDSCIQLRLADTEKFTKCCVL